MGRWRGNEGQTTRDVTKFDAEIEHCRISHNFTAFDLRRLLKLPSPLNANLCFVYIAALLHQRIRKRMQRDECS